MRRAPRPRWCEAHKALRELVVSAQDRRIASITKIEQGGVVTSGGAAFEVRMAQTRRGPSMTGTISAAPTKPDLKVVFPFDSYNLQLTTP